MKIDEATITTIHKNRLTFKIKKGENASFWEKAESGNWEPTTYQIFDDFISSDTCYIDIGAWIGPTVLYAAQLAERSFAFEPDPVAFEELRNNVELNQEAAWASKLSIYNKAVASHEGILHLGNRGSGGDSTSSILFSSETTHWEVEAISIQKFLRENNINHKKFFIKMDIEGGEYNLIPNLKPFFTGSDAVLFLSIHPKFLLKSLLPNEGNGLITNLIRRVLFVWQHTKLAISLPFRYFYFSNGTQINIYRQLVTALVRGDFLHEIVATNRKWLVNKRN